MDREGRTDSDEPMLKLQTNRHISRRQPWPNAQCMHRGIVSCARKKEFKNRKIEGWILCGRTSNALEENAKNRRILKCKISLDFPDLQK